jgi:hypothetical protein
MFNWSNSAYPRSSNRTLPIKRRTIIVSTGELISKMLATITAAKAATPKATLPHLNRPTSFLIFW